MQSFDALGDPTRRRIVEMLAGGELSAGQIAGRFEISAPAVSQHLKVLRDAHLVRVRVEAQKRVYQLDPDGIAEIVAWIDKVRRFWPDRLNALERAIRIDAGVTESE